MALVRDVNNEDDTQDPFYEIKGIITLEDIIEEIIGDEIVDETDAFVDPDHNVKVDRENFDWGKLRLLDAKITDEMLSEDEVRAVSAHLKTNYSEYMALLSDRQLAKLVATTRVSEFPTAEQEFGELLPKDLLYEKGVSADFCTLILNGKVAVLVGSDNFRSEVSSWSVLGIKSLSDTSYTPDFTAFVSNGPCRCLMFTREKFTEAVDASALEKLGNSSHSLRSFSVVAQNEKDLHDPESKTQMLNSSAGKSRPNRDHLMSSFRKSITTNILDDTNAKQEATEIIELTGNFAEKSQEKDHGVTFCVDHESNEDKNSEDERKRSSTPRSSGGASNLSPLQEKLSAGGKLFCHTS